MGKTFTIIEGKQTPDFPAIMLATIVALKELGETASIRKISECIIKNESISEDEQSYTTPKNKRGKLHYYLGFARTRLKMVNALENPSRGIWTLTKEGIKINSIDDARQAFDLSSKELERRNN